MDAALFFIFAAKIGGDSAIVIQQFIMSDIKTVSVFCASSSHVPQVYMDDAFRMGRLLASRGIRVITGGGFRGLMASVEEGALSNGGKVTAVIPQFMVSAGWLHKDLNDVHITNDMQERKKLMIDESDAVIILPGGCGTLDEAMEVLTLKQLGLYLKPVVFLNTNGFYDLLTKHLERLVAEKFMKPDHLLLWAVANTPEELIKLVYELPDWDARCGKLTEIQ